MRRYLSVFALVGAVAFAGCSGYNGVTGGNPNPPPPPPTSNTVNVDNDFYDPQTKTVPVGTTITWQWQPGATQHSVTFSDNTGSPIQTSGTFTRTFTTAGTFPYQCLVHGAAMSGTIVVQ